MYISIKKEDSTFEANQLKSAAQSASFMTHNEKYNLQLLDYRLRCSRAYIDQF